MVENQHGTGALDAAHGPRIGGQQGHGTLEDGLVGDGFELDVAHVLHGPAGIVVGTRVGGRVVLNAEVHVGERAVRLVGADDVIAGGHVDGAGFESRGRGVDLDALAAQLVHHVGGVGLAALAGRDDPGIGGTVRPLSMARWFLR